MRFLCELEIGIGGSSERAIAPRSAASESTAIEASPKRKRCSSASIESSVTGERAISASSDGLMNTSRNTRPSACAATVPCGRVYLVSFGHMSDLAQPAGFPSFTLASMALCGFLAVVALMLLPEPLDADDLS